jgi:rod shape-determining protein MreC
VIVSRPDRRRRTKLLLVVVTSLAIMTVDQRGSGAIDSIRSTTRDVASPMQNLADDVLSPVDDFFDSIGRAGSLQDENMRLRRELATARGRLAESKAATAQLQELQQLLDLQPVASIPGVAARIVDDAVGNHERTLQIDHGTSSGIRVGMPVVVGGGLVGRVVTTSRTRATVRRLDDERFAVGVQLVVRDASGATTLGDVGIASGTADRDVLDLGFVQTGTALKKGQLVVTSGRSDVFPPGVPVAMVQRVASPGAEATRAATLRPVVDIDRVTTVKVLFWSGAQNP